jgi:hypothetical protein
LVAVVCLAAFGGAIALNDLLVRALFDKDYVSLYLSYGALTNLVVVLFFLAWGNEVERHTSLISAHPAEYLAGNVALGMALMQAWRALIAPGRKQYAQSLTAQANLRAATAVLTETLRVLAARETRASAEAARIADSIEQAEGARRKLPWVPIGLGFIDFVLSFVLGLGLLLALVAWLLLVVPPQYFVYLVAGAPAREAVASPERASLRVTRGEIMVVSESKEQEIAEGATESGYSAKPVTFTAALAAVLLFALNQLVG